MGLLITSGDTVVVPRLLAPEHGPSVCLANDQPQSWRLTRRWVRGTMMASPLSKWCLWMVVLFLVGGCLHPVAEQTDQAVCHLASRPIDLEPIPPLAQTGSAASGQLDAALTRAVHRAEHTAAVQLTFAEEPKAPDKSDERLPALRPVPRRLEVPRELPGAGRRASRYHPQPRPPRSARRSSTSCFPT